MAASACLPVRGQAAALGGRCGNVRSSFCALDGTRWAAHWPQK